MALLEILQYPDKRLKQSCDEVVLFDEALRTFLADLEETMRAGPGGVGIAAPQVGRLEQIALVDVSAKKKIKHHGRIVLINPEIIEWQGSVVGREGCLSLPDFTGNVIRAETITLEAQDEFGERQRYKMEGYEARAVQHELDHLKGMLFLDRLVSRRSDLFKRKVYK